MKEQTVSVKPTQSSKKGVRHFWKKLRGWLIFFVIVGVIYALMKTNNQYSSPGFYGHLSIPGRFLIANFAQFVGGMGMGIILLTAIVRLCLMPGMIHQSKSSTRNSITQEIYKPKILKIRKGYIHAKKKAKMAESHKEKKQDRYEATQYSKELTSFYKKHNIGLQNMGCGTVLAQIPIFGMLYASIRYSPDIQHANFLGMPLGKPSIILGALAFVFYLINALIMKYNAVQHEKKKPKPKTADEREQRARSKRIMNIMMFAMPLWILFISMSTSAGLTLYFCVGGVFIICQQLYLRHIMPGVKKQAHEDVANAKKDKGRDKRIKAILDS